MSAEKNMIITIDQNVSVTLHKILTILVDMQTQMIDINNRLDSIEKKVNVISGIRNIDQKEAKEADDKNRRFFQNFLAKYPPHKCKKMSDICMTHYPLANILSIKTECGIYAWEAWANEVNCPHNLPIKYKLAYPNDPLTSAQNLIASYTAQWKPLYKNGEGIIEKFEKVCEDHKLFQYPELVSYFQQLTR